VKKTIIHGVGVIAAILTNWYRKKQQQQQQQRQQTNPNNPKQSDRRLQQQFHIYQGSFFRQCAHVDDKGIMMIMMFCSASLFPTKIIGCGVFVCNKAQPATTAAAASLNPLVRGRRGAAILRSAPLRRPSRPLSIMVREEGTEGGRRRRTQTG
jgi:hypothetical protein